MPSVFFFCRILAFRVGVRKMSGVEEKQMPWTNVLDETGREYWWNEETDEVTWTNPHTSSLLQSRLLTSLRIGWDVLTRACFRRWRDFATSTPPFNRVSPLIRALDAWMATRVRCVNAVARELTLADQMRDLTSLLVDSKLQLAEALTQSSHPTLSQSPTR